MGPPPLPQHAAPGGTPLRACPGLAPTPVQRAQLGLPLSKLGGWGVPPVAPRGVGEPGTAPARGQPNSLPSHPRKPPSTPEPNGGRGGESFQGCSAWGAGRAEGWALGKGKAPAASRPRAEAAAEGAAEPAGAAVPRQGQELTGPLLPPTRREPLLPLMAAHLCSGLFTLSPTDARTTPGPPKPCWMLVSLLSAEEQHC